jgi:hypothetical protein
MKKVYQAPEMINVLLDQNDILTLSGKLTGIADEWNYDEI